MQKGFKSKCENKAHAYREELGFPSHGPLRYEDLGNHLGISIMSAKSLPLPDNLVQQLFINDNRSWDAFTVTADSGNFVFYNPTTSEERRSNTIMHEFAHVICGHKSAKFYHVKGTSLQIREFSKNDEEEADWMAGCLLLPRTALEYIHRRKFSQLEIIQNYRVSADLLRFRINKTGISRQYNKVY